MNLKDFSLQVRMIIFFMSTLFCVSSSVNCLFISSTCFSIKLSIFLLFCQIPLYILCPFRWYLLKIPSPCLWIFYLLFSDSGTFYILSQYNLLIFSFMVVPLMSCLIFKIIHNNILNTENKVLEILSMIFVLMYEN